ncbi:MAG: hypothetical protein IPJ06_05360 [Saprospiraceae bacterium]|nr:hypothetical protein [Saprospiraceae bacterium]
MPTITATDNCDNNVTVTFVETQIDGTCPNSFMLIRTWTATDTVAIPRAANNRFQWVIQRLLNSIQILPI